MWTYTNMYLYMYMHMYFIMYRYMYIFRDLESLLSKTKSVWTWNMVNPAWEGHTLVEARGDTDVHIVRHAWTKGR